MASQNINNLESLNLIGVAKKATEAKDIKHGAVHVEIIYTKNGTSIVEIDSRMGEDNIILLIKYSTGIYIPKLVIDIALDFDVDKIKTNYICGSAIK